MIPGFTAYSLTPHLQHTRIERWSRACRRPKKKVWTWRIPYQSTAGRYATVQVHEVQCSRPSLNFAIVSPGRESWPKHVIKDLDVGLVEPDQMDTWNRVLAICTSRLTLSIVYPLRRNCTYPMITIKPAKKALDRRWPIFSFWVHLTYTYVRKKFQCCFRDIRNIVWNNKKLFEIFWYTSEILKVFPSAKKYFLNF